MRSKSEAEAEAEAAVAKKEKEGKKMDVHFCLTPADLSEEEGEGQRWYKIDPNAHSDDEQLRPQSIAKGIPFLSPNPVVLGPEIYLIGGIEDTKCPSQTVAYHVYSVPTCSVVVYDTKRDTWEFRTPMIGGKWRPLVAVRAGQIYVFSSSMLHIIRDEVWAELYDPTSDSWSDLPHPPSQLQRRGGYDFCYILNEYTQDQEILFKCSEKNGIWGFDVKTHQWNQRPEFNILDDLLPIRTHPPRVAVEDVFYFWEQDRRRLYAFNLATAKEITITNPEILEDYVNLHQLNIFLLHSGSDQLSLLWSEGDLPDKWRVCCLTFLIQMTTEGGLLHLSNPHRSSYIAKGECFRYCLSVTPTASSLSGYKRKSFASSRHVSAYLVKEHSEFQFEESKICARRTRHARRVYVDNIPSHVNGKMLLSFFHSALEKIGRTDSVFREGVHLDGAYVNDALGFAILEFPTIEHASNAMALDGIIYEGAPLRIRRPIDYNPGLAASLGPTQPNWFSNLMDIPCKPCGKTDDVVNMLRRTMQALAWETSNLNKSENGLKTCPSCVICLLEGVCSANVMDPELKKEKNFYTLTGEQYGELENVVIPLKQNDPAFGRVFLQYKNLTQSAQAMEGFCRSPRPFLPFYYPQNKFEEGDYSYLADYCDICPESKLEALEWDQCECKLHVPSEKLDRLRPYIH